MIGKWGFAPHFFCVDLSVFAADPGVSEVGAVYFEYWLSLPKKELMYLCVTKFSVQFQMVERIDFGWSGISFRYPNLQ